MANCNTTLQDPIKKRCPRDDEQLRLVCSIYSVVSRKFTKDDLQRMIEYEKGQSQAHVGMT